MDPRKVLYIEDDEDDIERMREGLDRTRFDIIGESYGEMALERLQADQSSERIKAVLVDAVELLDPSTGLPQRFQGDEITRKIREARPKLPVFAVSWFKRGGLNVPVDGVYPKGTLFSSPATFKDLEEALHDAILKVEITSFFPDDGGGMRWREKWGPEYIEFRNTPSFYAEERKLSNRAREDYDALADGRIGETYRRYRHTDSLRNLLIARRVIIATVFSAYSSGKGVAWKEVSEFLGFRFPEDEVPDSSQMHEGLRNFMNECGIKWGNIINRTTILREEEEWVRREGMMVF